MALTKAEMAERLFEEVGLNKREAKEFVDAFFDALREALSALLADGPLPPNPTVLDAPCGDFNWMREVRGIGRYIGMDIVEPLIADNQGRHGSETVRFITGDLTCDPLPAADVLVCRDCLIHLSDALAVAVLANFVRAGIPFLLLSTHGNEANAEAHGTGGYRPINFALAPFCFPEPLARLPDLSSTTVWTKDWRRACASCANFTALVAHFHSVRILLRRLPI